MPANDPDLPPEKKKTTTPDDPDPAPESEKPVSESEQVANDPDLPPE